MDDLQRRLLQRNRVRLVTELQVSELWDPLLQKGLFSQDMIEDIRRAGTRRDQARQLVIDLQTRGSLAFPLFIECLEETGQTSIAAFLREGYRKQKLDPIHINPVELPILELKPSGDVFEGNPRTNSDKAYLIEADPCGFCLIINNVNFLEHTDLSPRVGSNIDCEKLQVRFASFHFEVLVRENLMGKEICKELQSLAAMDHSQLDCCVIIILSHGCEARHIQLPGGVYGTDGVVVPVERVVTYFDGQHCPTLRGKPKLFFIQACGGAVRDKGFNVDLESPDSRDEGESVQCDATPFNIPAGGHDQPDAIASLPTPSDVLVSYSTYPGFVSWRDHKVGTWYIETLDRILADNAATDDLQNILVMVSNEVATKGICKQMPGYFNFLRKRFFFKTT
ncbi:caspase-9 isoform X2 [Ambystoma mexicanum]|uniref:caspase-9 isoform X2 n=1 Tax=Ambystoma mexicanum TaxID=8296 RepID=UPI0037E789C9